MKLFKWINDNSLSLITLLLLAFIPLYPKRPLLDIQHTWVYVRVEDFVVAGVMFLWILLLLRKKVSLKTPLTLPILLFWIIGGLATLHGVLLIFPKISGMGVHSNVALLSFLRKIEYMSLFFVAFSAMKDKKIIYYVIATLAITLFLVVGYGFGQKWYGFPAYLTMNEEFAKGVPIQISEFARVPSTFAGHYDLAAYLVLIIPLLVSIAFGFKSWLIKILLWGVSALGLIIMVLTVSRVSFVVLLLSMFMLLILQKKKLLIISLVVLNIALLSFYPSLLQRFGNTVTEIDVLVDAKTGEAIGNVSEVTSDSFENKIVISKAFGSNREVYGIGQKDIESAIAASTSAVIPYSQIPQQVTLLVESNAPTGETLPQGTGYINLDLSPIKKKTSQFFYQVPRDDGNGKSDRIAAFYGSFLIKRAKAYDLSYSTRFQGEWPRTIEAFKENIFLGSGYGSVSLAVDNNYLRILGESGLLGFSAFLVIFIVAALYVRRLLPHVDSPVVKHFVIGFLAGTFGLILNGVLIDVFEASKIAFTYWLLMGITLGLLHLYKKDDVDLYKELKHALSSQYAVIIYLFLITVTLFFSAYSNYFVGDDFTWLRWAASCNGMNELQPCNIPNTIVSYFTQSDGFFYRPGTKLYFLFMYSAFWLNQTMYHMVSILLHFTVAVLTFFIAKRILKSYMSAIISAVLFLLLSGHAEEVFWISATGHLFNAVFALLSLLSFMHWKQSLKKRYLSISILAIIFSLLFHELGVVVPLLIIMYDIVFEEKFSLSNILQRKYYWLLLSPLFPYALIRFISGSHWFNGDYSYNLIRLPFNVIGNIIGYGMFALFGPVSSSLVQGLRNVSREYMILVVPASLLLIIIAFFGYKFIVKKVAIEDRKIIVFSCLFFVIALLPFLGLGNIASRYNYLASVGFVFLFAYFLSKMYWYLLEIVDRKTVIASVAIIIIIFSSLHLFQLQKMHSEWHAAGERAQRFLTGLNEIYVDEWTSREIKLFFVDVPIKYGDAWIFPVGLKDAIWFVFRNENIKVYQVESLNQAFNAIQNPLYEKVFIFDSAGRLVEQIPPQKDTVQ